MQISDGKYTLYIKFIFVHNKADIDSMIFEFNILDILSTTQNLCYFVNT